MFHPPALWHGEKRSSRGLVRLWRTCQPWTRPFSSSSSHDCSHSAATEPWACWPPTSLNHDVMSFMFPACSIFVEVPTERIFLQKNVIISMYVQMLVLVEWGVGRGVILWMDADIWPLGNRRFNGTPVPIEWAGGRFMKWYIDRQDRGKRGGGSLGETMPWSTRIGGETIWGVWDELVMPKLM